MSTLEPSLETALHLWTVEDYHRMVEAGILQPDESVELIAGKIKCCKMRREKFV